MEWRAYTYSRLQMHGTDTCSDRVRSIRKLSPRRRIAEPRGHTTQSADPSSLGDSPTSLLPTTHQNCSRQSCPSYLLLPWCGLTLHISFGCSNVRILDSKICWEAHVTCWWLSAGAPIRIPHVCSYRLRQGFSTSPIKTMELSHTIGQLRSHSISRMTI